jgi:MFS transporter, SP family, arabinose:H+ symporter
MVVPEAPRWLIKVNRSEEARTVLSRIGGSSLAEEEIREIKSTLSTASSSLRQLFRPGLRKALFISLFLAIASELSGITIVFYYGPDILARSGLSLGRAQPSNVVTKTFSWSVLSSTTESCCRRLPS